LYDLISNNDEFYFLILGKKAEIAESFRNKESEYSNFKQKKSTDSIEISPPIEKLLNLFAGLAEYLKEKYLKKQIKKQKLSNNSNFEQKKKKKNDEDENATPYIIILNFLMKIIHFIFLALFAYFSLLATSSKQNENQAYEMMKDANTAINFPKLNYSQKYFSTWHFLNIYRQLRNLSSQDTFYKFILLSPIRFTFVIFLLTF